MVQYQEGKTATSIAIHSGTWVLLTFGTKGRIFGIIRNPPITVGNRIDTTGGATEQVVEIIMTADPREYTVHGIESTYKLEIIGIKC